MTRAALPAVLLLLAMSAAALAKPNILFVLIDDMGYQDLECFGGTRAKTPAVDRLATEGMRFTQFYVASPICSPSRCALITGQYPGRWRINSFLSSRDENWHRRIADWLDPKAPSVARPLADAGYHTAHVGKWHLGGQRNVGDAPLITAYGFHTSLTNFEGLGERVLPTFEPRASGAPFKHGPTDTSAKLGGPIQWVERHRVTEVFVDRAIEEMKRASAQGKPFYVNLWPDDVHSPTQEPPGRPGGRRGPKNQYVGVLEELDRQLGRAFDFIRSDPKLRDNTIILLASDNGPESNLGSAGDLRGLKGQLYEGGIRSPLIVWWPGGMPKDAVGTTNDMTVLCGTDVAPSLLALAGAKAPDGVKFDGQDLSDAIAGRSQPARQTPVMWVRPADRDGPRGWWPDLAMRDGEWKLLVERDGSRAELFNVVTDPNEKHNLAREQPDRVKRMSEHVIRWDKETNQSAPPGPRTKS